MTLIPDLVAMTERFARDIIGLPIPDTPTRLDPDRKRWASGALSEELTEFVQAHTLEDEADALLDLMYFAGGRLIEMGLTPGAAFEEVHLANMKKERGELSKRPDSRGYDAIKPDGWTPPDLLPYCLLCRDDIKKLSSVEQQPRKKLPRVLVIGYGDHGKDMVGGILEDNFGFTFTSGSEFCAEKVVWPAVKEAWAGQPPFGDTANLHKWERPSIPRYDSAQECFEGRSNHRKFWYDAICAFNSPDPTTLARAVFSESDIYCGIRSKAEFHAVKNAGLADIIVWVDRSDHLPPESEESCCVEPWMADYIIDNNGSVEQLEANVLSLFNHLMGESNAE